VGYANTEAMKLPDQLVVRYFRAGELDAIRSVTSSEKGSIVAVGVMRSADLQTDHWRDLGGGLGFVPDAAADD
jgi:hypothetical protein